MGDSPEEERRPKRARRETSYKAKAFEKFKQLKSGTKSKYEVEELENVYDTVDEREYVKTVLDRQDDDWIVDDDGAGYVEDGRDIFDDDLDAESIAQASKTKGVKRKKKNVSENAGKGNLKQMLSKMPAKKKEEESIKDDTALAELLGEIDDSPSTSKAPKPKVLDFKTKVVEKNYMKSFSLPKKAPTPLRTILASQNIKNEVKNEITPDSPPKAAVISPKTIKSTFKESFLTRESVKKPKVEQKYLKIEENTQEMIDMKMDIEVNDSQPNLGGDDPFNDGLDFSLIEEFDSQEIAAAEAKMEAETEAEQSLLVDDFDDELLANFVCQQENEAPIKPQGNVTGVLDTSKLPLVDFEAEKVFRFFYWDAFEDYFVKPGTVYLFGKTYTETSQTYASCCVLVQQVERKVFVLPRPFKLDEDGNETEEPVTHKDVYLEFNEIVMKPLNVKSFKSRFIQKKYAFDPEVPTESEYMEVRYSAKDSQIPHNKTSGQTFSKIFGTTSNSLENFLLDRKIKGPCWLDVKAPERVSNPVSWCKFEVSTKRDVNVNLTPSEKEGPPPPLVVACINMRYAINPHNLSNEVVMISCVSHSNYNLDKPAPLNVFDKDFCVLTAPQKKVTPPDLNATFHKTFKRTKVIKVDSERAVLNMFTNNFHALDPDLIVGHDLQGFQISILFERILCYSKANFSRLSRLKRTNFTAKMERFLFTGRLVCDIKTLAKESIRSRDYNLSTLCQSVLNVKEGSRIEIETEDVPKMFETVDSILKFIAITMNDTIYILKIMYQLNFIPLALQITTIAGNIMSRTLMGGRSERNEFLLLHAFSDKNYIVPDKIYGKKDTSTSTTQKKKPSYSGGLVLDPKVGLYDKMILLMDFNSLYPSIIQEYNICFTTLPPGLTEDNLVLPDKNLPTGILPSEIRKLVESRRQVKTLMKRVDKNTDLYMQYNIRQMALKLTANSMYGCLGFSHSRFFAKELAALITHKGREILTNTRDLVQKMSLDVIYGDTDSLMINTNITDIEQVNKIGNKIKIEVNKLYKQVELDIDGVFKKLLLLKKKKYASLAINRNERGQIVIEKEYKGLDIVRRDWSQLACEAGKIILDHILSEQSQDEVVTNIQAHLTKLKNDLEANEVPHSLLVITKQLTKDPKMYTDKNSQPHVFVALRCNKNGFHFRAGDTVPYVICEDGTQNSPTQRAYHLDELKSNPLLKIDVKYYLEQQIHPVIGRICEPIEGIDSHQIGQCLGMDVSNMRRHNGSKNTRDASIIAKPSMKFTNVEPFVFKCVECQAENKVEQPYRGAVTVLEKCVNDKCNVRPIDYLGVIQNDLSTTLALFVKEYYKGEKICEDPACDYTTRKVPLFFVGKYPVCRKCHKGVMFRKISETQLHTQISYFHQMFDLSAVDSANGKRLIIESRIESGFKALYDIVQNYYNHSKFCKVNLTELFGGFNLEEENTPFPDIYSSHLDDSESENEANDDNLEALD